MGISYAFAKPIMYVLRHGSAGDDESYNSPVDDPLDEKGLKQAHDLAQFFKGKRLSGIFSSSMKRAKETADIVGDTIGMQPVIDDRLDSLDVGDVKNIKDEAEADRVITHHVDNPHKIIPGGESIQQFRDRTHPALKDGVRFSKLAGAPALLATHHSVQHEVGNLFNGKSTSSLTKPGGVVAVYATDSGYRAVPIFRRDGDEGYTK